MFRFASLLVLVVFLVDSRSFVSAEVKVAAEEADAAVAPATIEDTKASAGFLASDVTSHVVATDLAAAGADVETVSLAKDDKMPTSVLDLWIAGIVALVFLLIVYTELTK
mmetsp:Transcript_24257/g.36773  ORF Transcript_24257/g.36773 Transcript_24257/m.36773 type:complete len:110 (+) Transcript_24257:133-462(+)